MSSPPRWWFELHAPHYDRHDALLSRYYLEVREIALELLQGTDGPPQRLLDVGAGTGIATRMALEKWPQCHVTLLDASPAMLEQAKKKLAPYADRCRYIIQNLETESVAGEYDAVLSCDALHHVTPERRRELFRELHDCLKPGGAFAYADIDSETLPAPIAAAQERLNARHRAEVVEEHGLDEEQIRAVSAERERAKEAGEVFGHEGHCVPVGEAMQMIETAGFSTSRVVWRYFGRFLLAAHR